MSYSKQYLMDQLEGVDYYDRNNTYNNDSYDYSTENYVDVIFEGFDRIYTYISPVGEELKQGEKYIISGNNGPETIEIVRGTYNARTKTGLNYKVLPIINKIEEDIDISNIDSEDSWIVNGYIIEKYKKNKHFDYYETTHVWMGGFNEENIKKFDMDSPKDTFVIFDEFMENKVYLGNFCLCEKDNFVELSVALSNDIFPPYTIKKECYDFLSKLIVVIRDFLLKNYSYDKSKYRISLEHAGPGGYEMEFLEIINSSGVMHVGSRFGISNWLYYFN